MPRIYLDHAATTPMRPEAKAAMAAALERWANPSSPHAEGRAARAALEDARARIKAALGWRGELLFTSGASEALWIALNRAKLKRRIVSAVEHDAVFRAAPDAEVVPVTNYDVDADALGKLLARGGPAVVAVQHMNSETGITQLVGAYTDQVRARGGILVSDCAQSAGKEDLPDADMIIVSAHKLGGPPGVGALLVRDLGLLEPVGGHEFGYRAGTENLPAILGFAAAAEQSGLDNWAIDAYAMMEFREALEAVGEPVGAGLMTMRLFAIAMPGKSAAAQLIRFDAMGFAVSAGSACSSGALKRSRALAAFDVPEEVAARTIRISLGWNTTEADLNAFRDAWLEVART